MCFNILHIVQLILDPYFKQVCLLGFIITLNMNQNRLMLELVVLGQRVIAHQSRFPCVFQRL